MKDWTSSFERGSRPVVGSSRSSRVGLVSRARAIATFCCIPRLICSTGRPTRFSRDAQPGQDRDRLALRRLAIEAVQPGREEEVLHRAELLEERGVDADPVDQALDRHLLALDVVAEDLDPALVEGQEPADEADERRLAGAVGAEDPVDVAALEAHRHVRDRGHRLLLPTDDEPLADVLDEEGGQGRRVGPGPDRVTGATGGTGRPSASFFSCGFKVAVTGDSRSSGAVERAGNDGKPRVRSDGASSVGLAALVSGSAWWAGKGIKKAGGPIWPTALVRPEGGPAACGLARDGHRSPKCICAGGRNASGEERRVHHS